MCNICGRLNCSDHVVGKRYNCVKADQIPYDTKLITFDMVYNPEMKYARVNKMYYSEEEMMELLPEDERVDFVFGKTQFYCSHCLFCRGYNPETFESFFRSVNEKRKNDG